MSLLSKFSFRIAVVILAVILSGLVFFNSQYDSDFATGLTWLPSTTTGQVYAPILGKHEDPGQLYFAPNAHQTRPLRIPKYALPPRIRPRTPMFIGFTNNNAMLIQCVLSYIAAGWPPADIIVVENTPTMDSNARGTLDRENYFFLDYPLLRSYGVSILQTSTLFTFAQLQNFFIRTALAHDWSDFFWSHMDVLVLADETPPFKPFYHQIVDVVNSVHAQPRDSWAIKWFSCGFGMKACDMLVLVNVHVWATKIGAWDPFIPYYISDCDAFSRMVISGYPREIAKDHDFSGHIFDVGTLLPGSDPIEWLFPVSEDEQPNSERYQRLLKEMKDMEGTKLSASIDDHRNDWQENHGTMGTVGDEENAWGSYDRQAFRAGWQVLSKAGMDMYIKKWGSLLCGLENAGTQLEDMWKPLYKEIAEKEEEERHMKEEEEEEEGDGVEE